MRMTRGSVRFFEKTVATWACGAAGTDAALLAEFEAANAQAVAAVKDFAQWLEKDLLPRSNGQYAVGEKAFLTRLRLAQLHEALLRDCRYVVGIKLHTAGWTVEQGAKLIHEKCFQQPANANEESRRGAYNPTYLYRTYCKLEVQQLARDYKAAKGAMLKQIHEAFVAQGSLPLPLVRRLLMER